MDARFEDADDRPLRLRALDAEDLEVVSSLMQDAAGTAGDLVWMKGRRRFALFLNRFRWEDAVRGGADDDRPPERVRTVVMAENVVAVRAAGLDPREKDAAVNLLRMAWEPAEDPEDPSGVLRLVFSGDGELEIELEALEVRAEDVTRPYVAPTGKAPEHPTD